MKTAFVIEDDANVVEWIAAEMGRDGWNIVSTGRYAAALETLTRESFDLVILDLKLPDSEIDKTLASLPGIRALAKCTPVIVMTGHPSFFTTRPECDAMLLKPFNGADLMASVKQATSTNRQCRALPSLASMLLKAPVQQTA